MVIEYSTQPAQTKASFLVCVLSVDFLILVLVNFLSFSNLFGNVVIINTSRYYISIALNNLKYMYVRCVCILFCFSLGF